MKYHFNIKKNYWIIILAFFSLIVSLFWFRNGIAKATGESGLLFLTIERHLDLAKYAWIETGIGDTSFTFIGAMPLYSLLYATSYLFSEGINQAMFFGVCIFLSTLGPALFIKYLYPKINQSLLVLAGIMYAFNPYSIAFIWNRFLYNLIFAYAVIPVLLFVWFYYLKTGKRYVLLVFFLSSFFAAYAFTGVAFLLTFLIGAGLLTLFSLNKNNFWKYMQRSLLMGFLLLGSQTFWFLSFYFGNRLGVGGSTQYFSEAGNLNTTVVLSQYYGGIVEKLRMTRADIANLAYDNVPWAQWYVQKPVYYLSFVPAILLPTFLFFFVKYRKSIKNVFLLISLFIATLLLINGTSSPLGIAYLQLYKFNANFQVLRNPYEKLGMLFILAAVLVWIVGLWEIKKRNFRVALFALIATCVWWYSSTIPAINGTIFTSKNLTSNNPKIGYKTKVPDYYEDAKTSLELDDTTRALALPITGEGIVHTWNYGYDGVESYNGIFDIPTISLNTTSGQLPEIANEINSMKAEEIVTLSQKLNLSHLIIRKDLEIPINSLKPDTYSAALKDSKVIFEEENKLTIYDVLDDNQSPKIFASNDHVSVNSPQFDANINTISTYKENSPEKYEIIYPDSVIEEKINEVFVHTENLDGFLPHVRFNLDSPLYPLIRIKEDLWKQFYPHQTKPIYITLAYKRLSEIRNLIRDNASNSDFDKAVENYKNSMEILFAEAENNIIDNPSEHSFWWLTFNVHDRALENSNASELRAYLLNRLLDIGVYPRYTPNFKTNSNQIVYRVQVEVPENGIYKLRLQHNGEELNIADQIQVDDQLLDLSSLGMEQLNNYNTISIQLEKGVHQIWVPIMLKNTNLLSEELTLSSLSNNQKGNSWEFDINLPEINGRAILDFEYRIIQGNGPRLTVYQAGKDYKPQLKRDFPSDSYYFDWTSQSVELPFLYDTNNLKTTYRAVPFNNCEQDNPLDLKCKNESFRQLYDKHSTFLLNNVNLKIIPDVDFVLTSDLSKKSVVDYKPKVIWQKINPAIYRVNVTDVSGEYLLAFLDQFHPGWKLYRQDENVFNKTSKEWSDFNSVQANSEGGIFKEIFLSIKTFLGNKISDDKHVEVHGYANGWIIDEPGSYILIYAPQRLIYIGWSITITTFIILLYAIRKNKKIN